MSCRGISAEAKRIEALLREHATTLAEDDGARACTQLWQIEPGSPQCEQHVGWFREHASGFLQGKLHVREVSSDVHRTQIATVVEAVHGGRSETYRFGFIVSCSPTSQVVGPNCPLWITGAERIEPKR